MKTKNQKSLEEFCARHEIPLHGSEQEFKEAMAKLSRIELEQFMYLHTHSAQDRVLKHVAGKFGRLGTYLFSIACGTSMLSATATMEIAPDIPTLPYIVGGGALAVVSLFAAFRWATALKINKLTRASQAERVEMAEKLVGKDPKNRAYAVCNYAIKEIEAFDEQYYSTVFDEEMTEDTKLEDSEISEINELFGEDFMKKEEDSFEKLTDEYCNYIDKCNNAENTSVL